MTDEKKAVTEGDREYRERMQKTNELAEKLQPPRDPAAERGAPAPVKPAQRDD
jgi:hypothetical protein